MIISILLREVNYDYARQHFFQKLDVPRASGKTPETTTLALYFSAVSIY
jgi:hypothetical protein